MIGGPKDFKLLFQSTQPAGQCQLVNLARQNSDCANSSFNITVTAVPIASTLDQDSRTNIVKEANQEDEEEVEIKTPNT